MTLPPERRGGAPAAHDPASGSSAILVAAICPYLLAEDGAWKAYRPDAQHRCHAVVPPAPLTGEQQRRLCLVADHAACPTFLEARRRHVTVLGEAGIDAGRLAARRAVALTRPVVVVLDRPFAGPHVPAIAGRTRRLAELALVLVLVLAAAMLLAARLAGFGLLGTG